MARRWPSGPGSRVVVLGVGISLLVVEWVATTRAFDQSVRSLNTIFDNAMPSISYLAQVQGTIGELAREMRRLDRVADARVLAEVESEVEVLLRSIERIRREYERFPVYPHEPEGRAELREALATLAAVTRRVMAEADLARRIERRQAELYPALDGANAVVRDLLRLNADQASRSARTTIAAHDRATNGSLVLAVLLNGVLVVLWLLLGRQVARTERERERRFEELDAFGGRVAHDLKAPLSTITMAAQLLRKDPALSEGSARCLDRIDRAGSRMNAMIEGLLSFAKAGSAGDPGARASVTDVLSSIQTTMSPMFEAERVAFTLDVEPLLFARTTEGVFGSIAQNLIRNAVAHLADAPTREVRVRARSVSPGRLALEVADTGPGIPEDVRRQLFLPFQRGSTSAEGHGLGLATVKRLVDGHGGTIEVATEVGRGTTFTVVLPGATSPEAASRPGAEGDTPAPRA